MTAIEWTDAVWNPTTGCDRVSPGCDHLAGEAAESVATDVVPVDVATGSAVVIEPDERGVASASTADQGVGFARPPQVVPAAMMRVMGSGITENLQVLGPVVELVAIDVVHDLATAECSSQCLCRHLAVLVDVPTRVREGMAWKLQKDVPTGRDRAPALPVGVQPCGLALRHIESVANRMEQG